MYKIQTTSSQLNMIKIKETAGHKAVGPKNPIIYTSCPTINILHVLYHINLFSWSAQQPVYICSSFPWKTSSSRAAVPTRALMRKQSSANFHQWLGRLCEKKALPISTNEKLICVLHFSWQTQLLEQQISKLKEKVMHPPSRVSRITTPRQPLTDSLCYFFLLSLPGEDPA
jgi:hypothetical protein